MQFEEFSQEAQKGIEKFRKFILSLDHNKCKIYLDPIKDLMPWHSLLQLQDDLGIKIYLPGMLATFLVQENVFSSKEIFDAISFVKDKDYWQK